MAVFKSIGQKAGVLDPDWPVIVNIGRDASVSWSFKNDAQAAARKFRELSRMALEPHVSHAPHVQSTDVKAAAGQFAARLVFLDGVRPDALETIGKSFSVYRYSEGVCIEWEEPSSGQIERRLLSTPTTAMWSEILLQLEPNPAPAGEPPQGTGGIAPVASVYMLPLSKGLEHWLRSRFALVRDVPSLTDLAGHQAAWMAQVLPGPLFGHATGALTLGALPRSTLARLDSGKALRSQRVDGTQESPQEMVLDQILDLMSEVEGESIDQPLLEAALDCLKTQHASGIAGNTRRLWATKLSDLDLSRRSVNRQTIVLISWMVHMCEAGTIGRPQAAVQTIKAYTGRILIPLAETLAAKGLAKQDPQDWEPEALLSVYREVVDRMSSGNREVAKTALANFHWYLQSVLDLGHLPTTISSSLRAQRVGNGEVAEDAEDVEDAQDADETDGDKASEVGEDAEDTEPPKVGDLREALPSWFEAEVIWEHEILWCIEACATEKDARLGEIGALMLSIARENPVRHQDLTRITMRNVAAMDLPSGPAYEIEVSRGASRGSLKSENAQRRLVIRESETVARMANWLSQRKREGAQATEFLFGEAGGQLKRYRSAAAHSLVNRLLKIATGNPRARLHHIRHTVISRKVAEILTSCTTADVGPLDVLAAQAGHGSPLTTLRTYTHQYEQPLRLWLDIGLRAGISLTAAEICGAYQEAIGSFERLARTQNMASEQLGENDNGGDGSAETGQPSLNGETGSAAKNPRIARVAKVPKAPKAPRSLKPNSLVQAALRRNRPLGEYGWERLTDLRPPACLPSAQDAFVWADRELPEKVHAQRPITYSAAAEILKSLADRKEVATVAYIHRLDQGVVEESLSQLDIWLAEVHLKLFPRSQVPQSRTPSYQRELILENLAVSLTQMRHGIWGVWAEGFDAAEDSALMDEVLNDWETHGKGRYLPLTDERRVRRLIKALTQGGLGRDEIRVVVQSEDLSSSTARSDNTASHAPKLGMIREMFLRELDLAPRVEFTKARKDRPDAYLRINPHPGKAKTPGKADLTTALKGWLVAWRFFRLLQNNTRTV